MTDEQVIIGFLAVAIGTIIWLGIALLLGWIGGNSDDDDFT